MKTVTLFAAVLLLALAACKTTPTPAPKATGEGEAHAAAKATQMPLQASLQTDPESPRMDKPFTLRLKLVNQGGAAVSGAKLSGEITMKDMDHGKTPVTFQDKGNGLYEGTASLPMAGEWELKVHAEQGSTKVDQVLPLKVGA